MNLRFWETTSSLLSRPNIFGENIFVQRDYSAIVSETNCIAFFFQRILGTQHKISLGKGITVGLQCNRKGNGIFIVKDFLEEEMVKCTQIQHL